MGWWETEHDIVIGDEPADIIGDHLDKALEECKKRWPEFTEDQFLATVAFSSGHIALDGNYGLRLEPNQQ